MTPADGAAAAPSGFLAGLATVIGAIGTAVAVVVASLREYRRRGNGGALTAEQVASIAAQAAAEAVRAERETQRAKRTAKKRPAKGRRT